MADLVMVNNRQTVAADTIENFFTSVSAGAGGKAPACSGVLKTSTLGSSPTMFANSVCDKCSGKCGKLLSY